MSARRFVAQQLIVVAGLMMLAACGGGGGTPTNPTPPPAAVTRIIALTGNLGFNGVPINTESSRTFNILNQGTGVLTVTSITATGGLTAVSRASWTAGTIPPGGSQPVTIVFAPKTAEVFSGTLTVVADHTSGTNTILMTGAGTLDGIPIYTRSGKGNNVFEMPSHVRRLRIQGVWDGTSTSNFIVRVGGSGVVNVILRDSFIYDGIHQTTGGTVEITSSNQITWTFTEVRQ